MIALEHGGTFFRASLTTHAQTKMKELAHRRNAKLSPMSEVTEAFQVLAYVNHNMWKANCNNDGCSGCEFVWPDEPLFQCCACWNRDVDGAWKRVVLPPDALVIESVLRARPHPRTRNWDPDQTVDDIKAENRAAGDPEEG